MAKKLLIVRSVSFQQLDTNIIEIKKQFHDHEIHLLTHEHGKKLAEKYKDIQKVWVYPYKKGFSFARKFSEKELDNFEAVIVPVSNISGAGFNNVLLFGFTLPAKQVYMCNLISNISCVSRFSVLAVWLRNCLFKGVSYIFAAVVWCFTLIALYVNGIIGKTSKSQ